MKKLFLGFFLVSLSLFSTAQTTFGIHLNGLVGSVKEKYTGTPSQDQTSDGRFSWKAGLLANVPMGTSLSFMPQLNVLSKGGKNSETVNNVNMTSTLKLTYIEVPLLVTYNTSGFFVGAGPSVSYGIGGKGKAEGGGQSISLDVKFDGEKNSTDNNIHYKALEIGAHFIAGYKLTNGFFVNAHYNLGLNNIDPEDNFETKNRYFGFGVGMMFGGTAQ